MAAGQGSGVVGRDEQAGLPVGADDLGQRATGGRHHGHAARHGLDRRQRETLVEGRHDGDLGLAVEARERVVADAAHAVDHVGQPESR